VLQHRVLLQEEFCKEMVGLSHTPLNTLFRRGISQQHDMTSPFVILREVGKVPSLAPGTVLVQGLPGMGLVGRLSIDHLLLITEAQEILRIYSSFLPPVVRVGEKGIGRLARLELYAVTTLKPNLLLLTGDFQPADIGIVTVLSEVLSYVRNRNVESVVALGGLRSEITSDVGAFGYDADHLSWLGEHNILLLDNHEISGAVGVLTALAHEMGLRSFGLLGKLHLSGTDPIAARNVLRAFGQLFRIDESELRLELLEEQIQEAEAHETAVQDLFDQAERASATRDDQGYYI